MSVAAYDAIAVWYDRSVRERALLSADALIAADVFGVMGDLERLHVCDVCCGQGAMARQMAARGAKVVGVDISEKLLEIARSEEETAPLGIVYFHDDAQQLSSLSNATFDGVLCNMALMDVPDIAATFAAVHRILRPGGWFVFTMTHPCFQAPPGQSYYQEGFWRSDNLKGVRGQVGAHHRMLSTYMNSLIEAGMFVQQLIEPRLAERDEPVVLLALCRAFEKVLPKQLGEP